MPVTGKQPGPARSTEIEPDETDTSPWSALRSKFLESLDPAEQVRMFDRFVWLLRRVDGLMPFPPLSLIAVGRKA